MGGVINIGSTSGLWVSTFSQYAPKPCSSFSATPSNGCVVELNWTDPDNYTTSDGYPVRWANTRIVRKIGSYPTNENDGTIVVTSTIKNQYQTTGYIDSGLSTYTTYYYSAFSCSTDGIYNRNPVQVPVTPFNYRIMTVKLNLGSSNPASIGSYDDDASFMTAGKNVVEWKDFFGYRPCLFKSGKVVGYLNPDDYTKFVDGSSADITSGNAGDVMIEFPRRGISISKSDKIVTVSMTDNPNNTDFKYYAHQRGSSVNKDYFYLGAYLGYVSSGKLRSLSGKVPNAANTLTQFDTYGKANGSGYGIMGFYQWMFVQIMYVLQYKGNLNSQTTHGYGLCKGSIQNTGSGNTKGLMYGTSTTGNPIKLFGLEDPWGNLYQLINNFYSTDKYRISTVTDDTVTDVSKYTDRGSYGNTSTTSTGFITDCIGSTGVGFTAPYNAYNGSESTYFCDYNSFRASSSPSVGGNYSGRTNDGIFCFNCGCSRSGETYSATGTRLGYL